MTRYDGALAENPYGDFVNYWEVRGMLDELMEYMHTIGDYKDREGLFIVDEINKIINKETN